jgi:hypothetical protein
MRYSDVYLVLDVKLIFFDADTVLTLAKSRLDKKMANLSEISHETFFQK